MLWFGPGRRYFRDLRGSDDRRILSDGRPDHAAIDESDDLDGGDRERGDDRDEEGGVRPGIDELEEVRDERDRVDQDRARSSSRR